MLIFPRRSAMGAPALLFLILGVAALPAVGQRSRLTGPIQSRQRVSMRGQVPGQVRTANDEGAAESNLTLPDITLILRPSDAQQADLDKLLADQQDSTSPSFHKWLTPEEYAQRFGASADDIERITDWLRQQNLSVVSVARGRNSIQARGTAQAVDRAFSTEIRRYRVNGERHFANATEPAIPADLSPMVAAIHGMDDFRPEPRGVQARASLPLEPAYTVGGGHYLAPSDFATIYNVKPLYSAGLDGTGQSIVVAGQTAIDLSDVRLFRARFGLPAADPQVILVPGLGNPGTRSGDVAESNLDLQWAGGIAPNAKIIYVYSFSALNAVKYAIDQNLAPIISLSYGLCELSVSTTNLTAYQTWARQANAQGITWVNSAGDSGGADCVTSSSSANGRAAVDAPASVPEITGIGGTTLASSSSSYWNSTNGTNGDSALSYIPETVWNDSTSGSPAAGGGGPSSYFLKPSWQTGPGVPNDGFRSVPDVSFAASPGLNGYFVYIDGAMKVYGGTSAGTPAFAGILALLNQYVVRTGGSTAGLGNINPGLYALAQTAPSVFRDITVGNNIVTVTCGFNQQSCTPGSYGYNAGPGYDLASGLGSVDAFALITTWNNPNGPGPFLRPSRLLISSSVRSSPTRSRQTASSNIVSGSTITLTAALSTTEEAVPSGEIVFKSGGVALGTATLQPSVNGAIATLTVAANTLDNGTNTILAEFIGSNVLTGASASTVINVTPQNTPITISSLANAASFGSTFAPGMLLTVFGASLSSSTWVAPAVIGSDAPLPTQAAGVTVTINGYAAPLLYVSPTQINLQVPNEVAVDTPATLIVNNNGTIATTTFTPSSAAPGIFVDQNFAPAPGISGSAGEIMTLYITGAGASPAYDLGVTVGGLPADVVFAAAPPALPGVVQMDYRIPAGAAPGKIPVIVYAGTIPSSPAMLEVLK